MLVCLVLAGCATIPNETPVQAVPNAPGAPTQTTLPKLGDMDPVSLIRGYLDDNTKPRELHAAARRYLSEPANSAWRDEAGFVIINDDFTVLQNEPSPRATPGPSTQSAVTKSLLVRGKKLGRLDLGDHTFVPEADDFEWPVTVRKQDGMWRIDNPLPGVVVPRGAFGHSYHAIQLFFFDPATVDAGQTRARLVPDRRYLSGDEPSGVPASIVEMLMHGPSAGLADAVRTKIPAGTRLLRNVVPGPDNVLTVNLAGLGELSKEDRRLLAAQIVLSLESVTKERIKVLNQDRPLTNDIAELRPADFADLSAAKQPSQGLQGYITVGGTVRSLKDNAPLAGPPGKPGFGALTAAQAPEGAGIAVTTVGSLRVGTNPIDLQTVPLAGGPLTLPSWRHGAAEVWTVAGSTVYRVLAGPDGKWAAKPVDATEFTSLGKITQLRLSRDGVRVAAIVGGFVVVGNIVVTQGSVRIAGVRKLAAGLTGGKAKAVDWRNPDELVVGLEATTGSPVVQLSMDGLDCVEFQKADLTVPIQWVASSPDRDYVVVDSSGMWQTKDAKQPWRPFPFSDRAAVPAYPG
ncbi:hypothetical protein D5S17_05950 [Pseudonocardiaceae bacterium YIM PH 21723]|nr:hypothetical protein D5S17_05950 [Pseudonocardiaceae bacterium YIM PH 21723]